jgi:hypothetical protein
METRGFVPFYTFTQQKRPFENPYFIEYLEVNQLESMIEECRKEYGYMFRNVHGELKSAMKFDKPAPDTLKIDAIAWGKARALLDLVMRPLHGKCKIRDFSELRVDKSTASGVPYKWMGCRTKGDVERRFPEHIVEFWHRAHYNNVPVYWSVSGKDEMLTAKKMAENDIRTFFYPPYPYHLACARMYADQNDQFVAQMNAGNPLWPFYVGFDRHGGNFHRFGEELAKFDITREGDTRQWDSTMFEILFAEIKDQRWKMLRPEDQTPDARARHDYLYDQIIHSLLLLPNGQILQKHGGNPSGSHNTTEDNCMGHLLVKGYSFFKRNPDATLLDFFGDLKHCGYSDDYLDALKRPLAESWTHKMQVEDYRELGVELKPESQDYEGPEGATFLGCTFSKQDGLWVPKFKSKRCIAGLAVLPSKPTPYYVFLLAFAMYVEGFYSEHRELLKNFFWHMRTKLGPIAEVREKCPHRYLGAVEALLEDPPSDGEIHAHYCGLESGSLEIFSMLSEIGLITSATLEKNRDPPEDPICSVSPLVWCERQSSMDGKNPASKNAELLAEKRKLRAARRKEKRLKQKLEAKASKGTAPAIPKADSRLALQRVEKRAAAAAIASKLASQSIGVSHRRVALAMSDPMDHPVIRYSGPFAVRPTAIAKPYSISATGWDNSTVFTGRQIPQNDYFVAAFRDPRRALVKYNSNVTAGAWEYQWSADRTHTAQGEFYPSVGEKLPLRYAVDADAGYSPHGLVLYAGEDDNSDPYLWVDATTALPSSLSIVLSLGETAAAGTWDYTVRLYRWENGEVYETDVLVQHINAAPETTRTLSVPLTLSGYYNIAMISCFLNGTDVTSTSFAEDLSNPEHGLEISAQGTCACFEHTSLTGFAANASVVAGLRNTALSLMYTNEASPLHRQGKIAGYQATSPHSWTNYAFGQATGAVGDSGFNIVSQLNGASVLPLEKGMYGFLRPTQLKDFDLRAVLNDAEIGANAPAPMPYKLVDDSDYLVMYAVCSDEAGTDGYITMSSHVEYTTDDLWREAEVPVYNSKVYEEAVALLSRMPQFHENPLHFADITKFLRRAAPVAGKGLAAAGAATGSPLLGLLGNLLSSLG